MTCNCNNGNVLSKAVRVLEGNAFTMRIDMSCMTVQDGHSAIAPFPIKDCADVAVSLVDGKGAKTELPFKVQGSSSLYIDIPDNLPVGKYGLEIKGTAKGGNRFRFFGKPDEVMEIVDGSEGVCFDMESSPSGYYDFIVSMGMLQMPQELMARMEDATDKSLTAVENANSATEEAKAQTEQLKTIPLVTWEEVNN